MRGRGKCRRAAQTTLAQRDVLRGVMLPARARRTWLTLRELARRTKFGEASISAQLRHLRKPRFGGFVVEKRCRDAAEVIGRHAGPVWEYRMSYGARRRMSGPARPSKRAGLPSRQIAAR